MLKLIRTDRPWNQYRFAPELIAWRDAVIANGGARPSAREMVRRNRLIRNHMLSGAWALTDDILMSGEDEVQSLVSLKRRFLCIRYNSPLWALESGHVLDGYASYIDWPFVPATHAVAMTATNKRLAIWDLRNTENNFDAIGFQTTSTNKMGLRPFNDSGFMVGILNTTGSANFTVGDSLGFSAVSTSSLTTMRGYRNGARLTDVTTTIASGLGTHSFYIGARNLVGVPDRLLPCVIPYAAIGAQLTDAQERATYEGVRDAVALMFYADDEEEE